MRAAILSIGDELAHGLAVDTNSAWLAQRLSQRGVAVHEIRSVDDDRQRIAAAIGELCDRFDLLLITGGLGPTPDDLTRDGLGDVIAPGEALEIDDAGLRMLEHWFGRANRTMPESNRRQAMRPRGAVLIENPHGTAPGLRATHGDCEMLIMPGVPREMKAMFEAQIDAMLGEIPLQTTIIEEIHTLGLGESSLAERLGDILHRRRQPRVGTSADGFVVTVRIYATGSESSIRAPVEQTAADVERLLQPYVFSRNGRSLPQAVGDMLRDRELTLCTVESCTGGLVGELVTNAPGSSDFFAGGLITYSNALKTALARVEPSLIDAHGAVSEPVARAMARGGIERCAADCAIAVTGIAGPGGGSDGKPVGTVFIAVATPASGAAEPSIAVRRFHIFGEREEVRRRTAMTALQMLRFELLGGLRDTPLLCQVARRPAATLNEPAAGGAR